MLRLDPAWVLLVWGWRSVVGAERKREITAQDRPGRPVAGGRVAPVAAPCWRARHA
jgi:hypothetical protein